MIAQGKGKGGAFVARFLYNKKRKISEIEGHKEKSGQTEITELKKLVTQLTNKCQTQVDREKAFVNKLAENGIDWEFENK